MTAWECRCGSPVMMADTEDWEVPLCPACFEKTCVSCGKEQPEHPFESGWRSLTGHDGEHSLRCVECQRADTDVHY